MYVSELIRGAWPVHSRDLLLRAAMLPPEPAREAWRQWNAEFDIEKSPWADVRLLGSVAKRIEELQPDYPHIGRLKGIRRFIWSQSQMCLAPVRPLLRSLAEAGAPLLLVKGAARHAADPASAADRLLRDVDVLVPLDRALEAYGHAQAEGWELWGWQLAETGEGGSDMLYRHNAWSLRKDGGEIDLHHFSIVLNRNPDDDAGLWARARPASFQGVPVMLPSPADSLLLTIVHGVRHSEEGIADWAIDAAAEIDRGAVDWQVLEAETAARRLHAPVLAGLSYLAERLGRPVPMALLKRLVSALKEPFLSEFATYVQTATPRVEQMRACVAAASRRVLDALERQGIALSDEPPAVMLRERTMTIPAVLREFKVELSVPKGIGMTDRARVRVEVDQPDGAPHKLHLTAGRPDIYLFGELLAPPPTGSDVRSIEIEAPAALFLMRGVKSLLVAVRVLGPSAGDAMARQLRFQWWGPKPRG